MGLDFSVMPRLLRHSETYQELGIRSDRYNYTTGVAGNKTFNLTIKVQDTLPDEYK